MSPKSSSKLKVRSYTTMFSEDAVTLPEFTMTHIPLSKLQQFLVGSFQLFASTARLQTVITDTHRLNTHTHTHEQTPPKTIPASFSTARLLAVVACRYLAHLQKLNLLNTDSCCSHTKLNVARRLKSEVFFL